MSLLLTQIPIDWPLFLTAVLGGYLSGSVPYGLIISRLGGIEDVRKSGSGNIGATNVLRVAGKKLGAITLLLDMLKGLIPVIIARQFHMDYAVLAGLGAFAGHLFPVWLKFKGGKGVATSIGVLLGLNLLLGLSIISIWLITAAVFRYSSLAALTGFGVSPVAAMFITKNFQIATVALILTIIIWARHHQNIKRLVKNEESKINFSSTKE